MTFRIGAPASRRETRRDQIARFIGEYALQHTGNTPSLGEIAKAFGISRQAVYFHTIKLCAERRAEWKDGEFILNGSEFYLPDEL